MATKDTWFYRDGDVELGPTKADELTALVRKGMVAGATPIRRAADTAWTTAAEASPGFSPPRIRGPAKAAAGPTPRPMPGGATSRAVWTT